MDRAWNSNNERRELGSKIQRVCTEVVRVSDRYRNIEEISYDVYNKVNEKKLAVCSKCSSGASVFAFLATIIVHRKMMRIKSCHYLALRSRRCDWRNLQRIIGNR